MVIREDGAPCRQHRLLAVVFGHFLAGGLEIFHDPGIAFLVKRERQAERLAHRFPRQIVRRWAETSGQHDQVAALHRLLQLLTKPAVIVAHRRLMQHLDAEYRQLLR